jgi:hypothetical protein
MGVLDALARCAPSAIGFRGAMTSNGYDYANVHDVFAFMSLF